MCKCVSALFLIKPPGQQHKSEDAEMLGRFHFSRMKFEFVGIFAKSCRLAGQNVVKLKEVLAHL